MFDGSRRRARSAAAAALRGRLDRLAREWLPPAESPRPDPAIEALAVPVDADAWQRLLASAVIEVDGVAPDTRRRQVSLGGWTPSALRGLVALLAIATALVAWWWWSGRPVAVAVPPTVVATGASIIAPSANPQPTAAHRDSQVVASPTTPDEDVPSAEVGAPVVVHVAGLVARPGLVRLPAGSRVADAITAAGGVTKARAAESVNLARPVADGEQIVVTMQPPPLVSPGVPMTSGSAPPAQVDLNLASVEQLEGLPGVGPVLAQRIATWRSDNGPFRAVDELGEVSGIGEATLAELRPLVRV